MHTSTVHFLSVLFNHMTRLFPFHFCLLITILSLLARFEFQRHRIVTPPAVLMTNQLFNCFLSSTDILAGTAGMFNNYNLCHVKTINWEEILSIAPAVQPVYVYNFDQAERECPPCDKSCTAGCWGEGKTNVASIISL